jgi:hypothetical protein
MVIRIVNIDQVFIDHDGAERRRLLARIEDGPFCQLPRRGRQNS